jgi:4'-phosphopantetheinyl transferase
MNGLPVDATAVCHNMGTEANWLRPRDAGVLCAQEVHVWRAYLELPRFVLQELEQTLSPDERQRAGRFRFASDRCRFVAARGVLRQILARYLDCHPSEAKFSYGPFGKPALAPGCRSNGLQFSLAHSGTLAVYAIAKGPEVGIDVEEIRPLFVQERIAEQFFAQQEVGELRALPLQLQPEAFFNCWTRKEAYVKARGNGLQIALDSFVVSLAPGKPAEFRAGADPGWSLHAFTPAPGYIAALATTGQNWRPKNLGAPFQKESRLP